LLKTFRDQHRKESSISPTRSRWIRAAVSSSATRNNRIVIMTQDGEWLAEWAQFSRPSGIYIDKDDDQRNRLGRAQ
jgi:hypothetical protein